MPPVQMAAHRQRGGSPWQSVAAARAFLRWLVGADEWSPALRQDLKAHEVARWLVQNGIGPLAYGRSRELWPELAAALRHDAYSAAAENSFHFRRLQEVVEALQEAQIPMVLLKGAALAGPVYHDPLTRTMSDIDLWIPQEAMEEAVRRLQARGFVLRSKHKRPLRLELLSEGEVQMLDSRNGLVELHGSPLKGWWINRAAALDKAAMWQRARPLQDSAQAPIEMPLHNVHHLAAEDAVVQLAVHTAVNHRFSLHAVRSLVDLALLARSETVAWDVVAQRAREWRVATAVWTVLDRLQSLIGLPQMEPALVALRPSRLRRHLLQATVSPQSLLAGDDHRQGLIRHLLWLLLVDRPSAAARLVYRTLWPEPQWLAARYGGAVSHWQHLWRVLRYGEV